MKGTGKWAAPSRNKPGAGHWRSCHEEQKRRRLAGAQHRKLRVQSRPMVSSGRNPGCWEHEFFSLQCLFTMKK